ncbi:MAG TPA: IS5 family transposase [Pirellulaceae bacterium]|nr:IS5 family transposase [Pirellulaceae bacterium]
MHRRDDRAGPSLRRRRRKKSDPQEPRDHALGRSRGGFSTKIHLLCDGEGLPLHFHLTPGQAHESTALEDLLDAVAQRFADEDDVPLVWPVALAGDKGYRAAWIDEHLLSLGIRPVVPSKKNEDRDARPVEFDREAYRRRNVVERLIGWLKEFRRVFARYEKTAINFGGMIKLALLRRYLRIMTPTA